MKLPGDKRKGSPVDRFRSILSAEKEQEQGSEPRKPTVVKLPRARAADESLRLDEESSSNENQDLWPKPSRTFLPTFWTIAAVLSLVANIILFVIVINLLPGSEGQARAVASGDLLLGLYSASEQIDQVHIKASLPIESNLPISMSIPVQTNTRMTLANEVTVQGANVKISTALFNIDAPANITLPAGTVLDVTLDLSLPVETNVPIALNVPLDIALQDTDLHTAILTLQDAIRPMLCEETPDALSWFGGPVCR